MSSLGPLAGVGLSVAAPGRKPHRERTRTARTARSAPRNKLRVGSCHGRTVAGWNGGPRDIRDDHHTGRSEFPDMLSYVIPVVCLKMGYSMDIFKSCYSGK